MREISRSGRKTHDKCDREYYHAYLQDGTGYSPSTMSHHIGIGLAVHAGLEDILGGYSLDIAVGRGVAEAQKQKLGAEDQALVEVCLRGWYRTRWPEFKARYRVLDIEKERRTLLAPNVTLMSRTDGTLQEIESNEIHVLNWKTASSLADWERKWHMDVQAWTEALATEVDLGLRVSGVLFEGLYKGVYKDGRWCNDLLYGYKMPDTGKDIKHLFSKDGWLYRAEYTKPSLASPWQRFAVWEEKSFGAVPLDFWVRGLPWDQVSSYFATSNPVFKDDRLLQAWVEGTVREETEVEAMLRPEVSEEDRLVYFRQKFSYFNCKGCAFKEVCIEGKSIGDLVEAGKLAPRVDHHQLPGAAEV